MKVIVIEGCDGTGKSTYIEKIAKSLKDKCFNVHILRMNSKNENTYTYYKNMMCFGNMVSLDYLIFDRSWISELVYSKVFREGNTRITKEEVIALHKEYNIDVILLENDYEKILKSLNTRGEDFFVPSIEVIKEISEGYLTLLSESDIKYMLKRTY